MPEGNKGGKTASANVHGTVGVSAGGSETVQEKRTIHRKTVFGHETSSDETVVTETSRQSGGNVHVDLRINPAPAKTEDARLVSHPKGPVSVPVKHRAHAPMADAVAKDAIIITSGKGTDGKDADIGVDAREDAERLYKSVSDLRKVLGRNGVLPVPADIAVKGVDQIDALKLLIQKDYTGQQEASLSVSYTDHLGKAFNEGLGEVEITHDNIIKVAGAYEKATAAVKEMVTHIKPGEAIRQDEISALVRNTIRKELRGIPMQ